MVVPNNASVIVGCCGFGIARPRYVEHFSTVEVQQTFYEPPQILTLKNWRVEVPIKFDFAIKAWQLITHGSTSPTYRRLKTEFAVEELKEAGSFNTSAIVEQAWKKTLECATALKSSRILFQCPASFKPTEANIDNLRKFFLRIDRPDNCLLCWEPRGKAWTVDLIVGLCGELDLVHVVDPFVTETVTPQNLYYRMHGRTGWRHEFADEELDALRRLVPDGSSGRVYFNNVRMIVDASRFQKKLINLGSPE
ncbi:MAG: DUF72 domain-containing protein [Cyanobacteria bacterium SZAS-4]|nr:DUF72 domain-containing protein [Cyanobacteria bacterium SZAS-4]